MAQHLFQVNITGPSNKQEPGTFSTHYTITSLVYLESADLLPGDVVGCGASGPGDGDTDAEPPQLLQALCPRLCPLRHRSTNHGLCHHQWRFL